MWAFLLTLTAVVCHVIHLDGARVLDANNRFRYALHRNWRLAHRRPTIARLLQLPRDVRLEERYTITTVHGVHRCKLRELYKDMPVIGTSIEADIDDIGRYAGGAVTGTLVLSIKKDIPNPELCQLTELEAQDIVLKGEGLAPDTHILRKRVTKKIFVDKAKKAHMVFATDILTENAFNETRPYYLIDCCDGSVLKKSERLETKFRSLGADLSSTRETSTEEQDAVETTTENVSSATVAVPATPGGECETYVEGTGGNPKTGDIVYSSPPYCLDLMVDGDTCFLENEYIKVVDLKQTKNETKTEVVSFKCSEGYNDAINEASNPALDALYYGTAAFKMFEDWYDGKPLSYQTSWILVHYGNMVDNAFWNGEKMLFGDGSHDETYPLVGPDIIGHELGHAISEENSELEYSGQSGGIDEAFSDITGEVVEAYVTKTDWLVGFDLSKSETEALRYFEDPTRDGVSIKDANDFENDTDVHYSSGVFNHAFYQIVIVGKLPIKYAYEGFLIANRMYWKEDTGFVDGACSTIRGAYDAGLDTDIYSSAFTAVGINACPLTKFLQILSTSTPRSNILVSSIRQPLFGIETKNTTKKIVVEAVSGTETGVKLALSRTESRSNPDASGTGRVELTVSGIALYYVRIFTDSTEEIDDVRVTLELE